MKVIKCDRCGRRSDDNGPLTSYFTDMEFTVENGYSFRFETRARHFDLCAECYRGVVLAITRAIRKEPQA